MFASKTMLLAAAGWILTALSTHAPLQLVGVCMAASGSYTAMSIFWTTPDQALSFRAVGIAVINAVGNIGSALNPLVIGWLKDLTHSFGSGFVYAAILMIIGALLVQAVRLHYHAYLQANEMPLLQRKQFNIGGAEPSSADASEND